MMLILAVFMAVQQARADQNDPRLDKLFGRLHVSDDRNEIRQIEIAIWQIWHQNKSDTVNLFMGQGIKAMQNGALKHSLQLFNQVVNIAPDFAEGWNKKATVLFYLGRYEESIEACGKVLDLEPRHFGALSGLGMIYTELRNPKKALDAYQRLLKVHPKADNAKQKIKALKEVIEGSPT